MSILEDSYFMQQQQRREGILLIPNERYFFEHVRQVFDAVRKIGRIGYPTLTARFACFASFTNVLGIWAPKKEQCTGGSLAEQGRDLPFTSAGTVVEIPAGKEEASDFTLKRSPCAVCGYDAKFSEQMRILCYEVNHQRFCDRVVVLRYEDNHLLLCRLIAGFHSF